MLTTVEERRRRSRSIVFAALLLLVVLYTVKFSFPQHTVQRVYTTYANSDSAELSQNPKPSTTTTIPKSISKPEAALSTGLPKTTIDTKAAVIIETRFRTNLIPLILHFSSVLGPTWPILIYTSVESVGLFSSSAALTRHLRTGLIQIRILPQTTLFTNSDSVNAFMTKPWLWESLAPVEHILLFQSDSMLCANAARSVDDYFEFDFVGAPIRENLGRGYNGGLSLRKRSSVLRILGEWDWLTTKKDGDRFEDQWFYNRLVELQERENAEGIQPEQDGAINLPTMEVARTFSVETIDYPHPLGVHQVHRWLETQMLSLDEWCPEYKLCSSEHVVDT